MFDRLPVPPPRPLGRLGALFLPRPPRVPSLEGADDDEALLEAAIALVLWGGEE